MSRRFDQHKHKKKRQTFLIRPWHRSEWHFSSIIRNLPLHPVRSTPLCCDFQPSPAECLSSVLCWPLAYCAACARRSIAILDLTSASTMRWAAGRAWVAPVCVPETENCKPLLAALKHQQSMVVHVAYAHISNQQKQQQQCQHYRLLSPRCPSTFCVLLAYCCSTTIG